MMLDLLTQPVAFRMSTLLSALAAAGPVIAFGHYRLCLLPPFRCYVLDC